MAARRLSTTCASMADGRPWAQGRGGEQLFSPAQLNICLGLAFVGRRSYADVLRTYVIRAPPALADLLTAAYSSWSFTSGWTVTERLGESSESTAGELFTGRWLRCRRDARSCRHRIPYVPTCIRPWRLLLCWRPWDRGGVGSWDGPRWDTTRGDLHAFHEPHTWLVDPPARAAGRRVCGLDFARPLHGRDGVLHGLLRLYRLQCTVICVVCTHGGWLVDVACPRR